jgi:hypothetical protein
MKTKTITLSILGIALLLLFGCAARNVKPIDANLSNNSQEVINITTHDDSGTLSLDNLGASPGQFRPCDYTIQANQSSNITEYDFIWSGTCPSYGCDDRVFHYVCNNSGCITTNIHHIQNPCYYKNGTEDTSQYTTCPIGTGRIVGEQTIGNDTYQILLGVWKNTHPSFGVGMNTSIGGNSYIFGIGGAGGGGSETPKETAILIKKVD